MITDAQVRKLVRFLHETRTLSQAAAKANMDEKTARKYRRLGKQPSEVAQAHTWATRVNPFEDVWP